MLKFPVRWSGKAAFCGSTALLMSLDALSVGMMLNPPSKNTGLANAGSAVYATPVAVHNNPASMALIDKKTIEATGMLVVADWDIDSQSDCAAESGGDECEIRDNVTHHAVIPTVGLVRPMDNGWTWGFSLGALAGVGMDYGHYSPYRAIITENSVDILEAMNSLSYKINDNLSVGIGLGITYGVFAQNMNMPRVTETGVHSVSELLELVDEMRDCPDGSVGGAACKVGAIDRSGFDPADVQEMVESIEGWEAGDDDQSTTIDLDGDDFAAKVVVGATYKVAPGHTLGISYHAMSDFSFEGTSTMRGEFLSDEPEQKLHTTLSWAMPDRLFVSGSHEITEDLTLYWDFERVYYHVFESTDLRLDGYPEIQIDRNFEDANRYAIGAEYDLDERITLQFGLSYDESPVDDEDRMADVPVEEIFKTFVGGIYKWSEQMEISGFLGAEFLGEGQVEKLASLGGHDVGADGTHRHESDTVVYVSGVTVSYNF